MDKISNECLEIVLYVGLKDEEVAVGIPASTVMGAADPSSAVPRGVDHWPDTWLMSTRDRQPTRLRRARSMARTDRVESLEREKTAVAGAYCNDLRLHFKHGVDAQLLTSFVSGCRYTCFPGILSCFAICPSFKPPRPHPPRLPSLNPLFFFYPLSKTAKLK